MSSEIFNSTTAHEGVTEKAIHTEVAETPAAFSEWEKPDTAAESTKIQEGKASDEASDSAVSEVKTEQDVEASPHAEAVENRSDSIEAIPDSQQSDAASETLPESNENRVPDDAKLTAELWRGESEHWFAVGEDAEIVEGFASPHDASDFAESIARGEEIKERLDAALTADGEEISDLVDTHLSASESSSEHPLGESYTEWFKQEYGEHPYTETRQEREVQMGKSEGAQSIWDKPET